MVFAVTCFGLESLVCTVLTASWGQHLYYAGDYLQYFVVFAKYCLELVLGSIPSWFRVYLGLFLVAFRLSVRWVRARVFLNCFTV